MRLHELKTELNASETYELQGLIKKQKTKSSLRQQNIDLIKNKYRDSLVYSFESITNTSKFDVNISLNIEEEVNQNNANLDNLNTKPTQPKQYFETVSFFNTFGGTWSQPGGKGNPVNITYSYINLFDDSIKGISNADIKTAIEEAFSLWSSVAPLNFTEVPDNFGNAQIRIGQEYIDGRSNTLAFAFSPPNGDIRFDNSENWNQNLFLETAIHEIGHSLGLDHENDNSAIMNPSIQNRFNGLGSGFLLEDDINGIRSIYGNGSGSVNPLDDSYSKPKLPDRQKIKGTVDNDILLGNDRDNHILGLAGDDYLVGGKGNDKLIGGKGADIFAFESLDGSVDIIEDFKLKQGDRIEVSRLEFGSGGSFSYNPNSGGLFFDDQEFVTLANKPSLADVAGGLFFG